MRSTFILLFTLAVCVAQPQPQYPGLTFTVVRNAKGKPMRGPLINAEALRGIMRKSNTEPWSVEMYFTVSKDYPYGAQEIGGQEHWFLSGTPIPGDRKKRVRFAVLDCYCTDQYLLVRQGTAKMRIDLPDPGTERSALFEHVMERSGSDATPEVIRFRPGRFTYAELANEAGFDELEARLAEGIRGAAAADLKKQLADQAKYYCKLPPPSPPAPPTIPEPPMTEERWAAFWAEQPPLKEARIEGVNADTVSVVFTGRIMLTGGCASSMPMFGLEMRTDSGWVDCFPFDESQMDCGLPWGDWVDHTMAFPLRYWAGVRGGTGKKELLPGAYRLLFMGGDRHRFASEAFRIE